MRVANSRSACVAALLGLVIGCSCGDSRVRESDAGVARLDGSGSDADSTSGECPSDVAGTWTFAEPWRTFTTEITAQGVQAHFDGICETDHCTADNCSVEALSPETCTAIVRVSRGCFVPRDMTMEVTYRYESERRVVVHTREMRDGRENEYEYLGTR